MPVHRSEGYWSIGLDLLDSSNYIAVNRSLIRAFGLHAAVIVGELASEAKYWKKRGLLSDGWFFSTVENLERATGLNAYHQREAIGRLRELGFVETEYRDTPRKRCFRINCMAIIQAIAEIDDKLETDDEECKSFTELTTSGALSERLAVHSVHGNNNNKQQQEKKKKERKKPAETFDSIIDGFTQDPDLREALMGFLQYRVASSRKGGKAFTNHALKLNLSKLSKLSSDPAEMVEIVNQTVERGWSGFFELKRDDRRQGRVTSGDNTDFRAYD